MKYDPQKHHRRSIRLKGYDYSQAGAYYFTIVAQNRACLFGDVRDGEMNCNEAGMMFWEQWNHLPERFPQIELDEFIVMPNHVHGILVITDNAQTGQAYDGRGAPLWSPSETGRTQSGQAHTGQAQTGQAHTGQAQTGQAQSGQAHTGQAQTGQAQGTAPTLGNILGAWKSIVTDEYIKGVHQKKWTPFERKLLQRDYWEHIIRNERELNAIREYILNNPANWVNDEHNPKRAKT